VWRRVDMSTENGNGLAAAAVIAGSLAADAALGADDTGGARAARVERRTVHSEGFEGDGKMTVWAYTGGYDVNFAGPSDERAATGQRSFKIDVTWHDDCKYLYWWVGACVPLYGNPVVRGRLHVERGGASFGHAYAVPEKGTMGHKVVGVEVRSLPNSWTEWRSSAVGTPGEAAYVQGVAVYLKPDEERRTVVYVDDLEIEAALPEGYEAPFRARVAEIEAARNAQTQARLQASIGTLPTRFAELSAEMDATPTTFPAGASAELRDYWERLCRYRDDARSQLKAQLAELRATPTASGVDSARELLSRLERTHPACTSLAAYAAAHPARPYIMWITDPISNDHVLPERFPVPGRAGTELSVSACPGEYEPASFAVYAIEELRDVTVQCGDARAGASVLPAAKIDVRIVKCWWQDGVDLGYGDDVREPTFTPELLLKDPEFVSVDNEQKTNTLRNPDAPRDARELRPVSVPAGTVQQFWITVHVPEDAKAGAYAATLTLRPGNAPAMSLSLRIRVLPFELAEPALTYSIYYRGQLVADPAGSIGPNRKSAQQYLAEMCNLKAHGVSHPTCYQHFDDRELFDRAIELRKEAGIAVDPLYSLGITMGGGPPTSPEGLAALKDRIRSALAQLRGHGIRELFIYGLDEAQGEQLKAGRAAFEAAHEAGAKLFVACGGVAFAMIGDLLDLAVYSGSPAPDEARKWHGAGHRIFSYDHPQVGMEQPETYRRNFGLRLWKSGYDGTMNYAYQDAFGDIYDDADGQFRDHVFAYPTADGVVDTIQWEGFREGVDDVRYLTTLLQAIERAKAIEDKARLAEDAERWVERMDLDGDLRVLRASMVEWILRLQG